MYTNAKLDINIILHIGYLWLSNVSMQSIANTCEVNKNTVTKWIKEFQDRIMEDFNRIPVEENKDWWSRINCRGGRIK